MKFRSAFDIIGPVMIGPSSSHTAGAVKIGKVARTLFLKQPKRAIITLYGSFAKTYQGHGTDMAIVAGLLNFETNDERIPDALDIAQESGMQVDFLTDPAVVEHPNTVKIKVMDDEKELEVTGVSIGGGSIEIIEINSFQLKLSGEYPAILVIHQDTFGVISSVTSVLSQHHINISGMNVARKNKGDMAMMVIEVDQTLESKVFNELESLSNITQVIRMTY